MRAKCAKSWTARWKSGRRRPYLLIGALPFAIFFAAIWAAPPVDSAMGQFAYFAGVYALVSISMTIVAIPYAALMPDLTDDYDERTTLATFRSVLSLLATLLIAVNFRPAVAAFGGDAPAWAFAGLVFALWILWPWLPIWWVTWERPPEREHAPLSFEEYVRVLLTNRNYQRLLFLFALGRIAIDLPLALFLHYFTYVIGHPDYFEGMMFTFILGTVIGMPLWMRWARGRDKRDVYIRACFAWILTFAGLLVLQPDWPYALMITSSFLSGAGYSAADMMPWSMVADLADEDELASGERREGIYVGVFTFVRKMSGAVGVALAFFVLDIVGFEPNVENSGTVLTAIRGLTAAVPILFILASILGARRYTLGHAEHAEILEELARRRGVRGDA